jgi:hypothetical protein
MFLGCDYLNQIFQEVNEQIENNQVGQQIYIPHLKNGIGVK